MIKPSCHICKKKEVINWKPNAKWGIHDEFYGLGEVEAPHTFNYWRIDWRFPFFHHINIDKTVTELQEDINNVVGTYINSLLAKHKKKGCEKK